jgi:hypothetical protein
MHIADLDGSVNVKGKSGKWAAFVTVFVVDDNGNPVTNANVTVSFTEPDSNQVAGQVSGATNGNGTVTLGSGNINGGSNITFTVMNVTHASSSYDAGSNDDPEIDSDGTTIIVRK